MRPKRPKKAAKRGQEGPKNRKQVRGIRNTPRQVEPGGVRGSSGKGLGKGKPSPKTVYRKILHASTCKAGCGGFKRSAHSAVPIWMLRCLDGLMFRKTMRKPFPNVQKNHAFEKS